MGVSLTASPHSAPVALLLQACPVSASVGVSTIRPPFNVQAAGPARFHVAVAPPQIIISRSSPGPLATHLPLPPHFLSSFSSSIINLLIPDFLSPLLIVNNQTYSRTTRCTSNTSDSRSLAAFALPRDRRLSSYTTSHPRLAQPWRPQRYNPQPEIHSKLAQNFTRLFLQNHLAVLTQILGDAAVIEAIDAAPLLHVPLLRLWSPQPSIPFTHRLLLPSLWLSQCQPPRHSSQVRDECRG